MNNGLISAIDEIVVKQGTIEFKQYEQLKSEAQLLASHINEIEVNEENIKHSKKLLAAVNKRVKEIEDYRISIKKTMLQPYHDFESCVKEIVNIVKDADNTVRSQVKELEENERELKRMTLLDLFNKRAKHYSFTHKFTFETFLKPNHLNKSTSINTIEKEMVEWLEKIERDIEVIKSLSNTEAVLTEYYDTKDVSTAIRIVNEFEQRKENVIELVQSKDDVKQLSSNKTIIELDVEDDQLAYIETFLSFNNFKYKIEKAVK